MNNLILTSQFLGLILFLQFFYFGENNMSYFSGIVAMFAIRGSDTIASNNVLEHKISQGHPFYPRIRKSTTRQLLPPPH